MHSKRVNSPVVWQAKVGKGDGRLHSLVTQVVDGKDAARILHSRSGVSKHLCLQESRI